MKSLFLIAVLFSFSGYAQETTTKEKKETSVESMVKSSKKDRKKKVEMCHECGKPEVNCDCKGEEHKKGE